MSLAGALTAAAAGVPIQFQAAVAAVGRARLIISAAVFSEASRASLPAAAANAAAAHADMLAQTAAQLANAQERVRNILEHAAAVQAQIDSLTELVLARCRAAHLAATRGDDGACGANLGAGLDGRPAGPRSQAARAVRVQAERSAAAGAAEARSPKKGRAKVTRTSKRASRAAGSEAARSAPPAEPRRAQLARRAEQKRWVENVGHSTSRMTDEEALGHLRCFEAMAEAERHDEAFVGFAA